MKRFITGAMVLGLLCSAAMGGGLNTEQVAGDAQWVAHVDVAALLKSGIAQFLLAEAEKKNSFLEGIVKVRETLGFDPLQDVRGITLYGQKVGDKSGVVVLDATAQQDKLLALLLANETYKNIEYGDFAIHQWTDQPKGDAALDEDAVARTRFGCFYDEKTIVIGSSLDLLKGAIDVLAGDRDSLAKTKGLRMLPETVKGGFLVAAAEGIVLPDGAQKPQAAVFRNVTDAAVQIGEDEGQMFADVTMATPTDQKAAQLRTIVQGFVALGQMILQEREDLPALGEQVEVGGRGNLVQIAASVPTESAIEMVKFAIARAMQAKARQE